ncbi:MAG: L,D-transpeptidase family protein [Nitrospirota bacterium]
MRTTNRFLVISNAVILIVSFLPAVCGADVMTGGETIYHVVEGDTLERIGAKLGMNWKDLVKENNIDPEKYLKIGQAIRANTRKIIPRMIDEGIIINIPDRMLYFFQEGRLKNAFPVGLGMPSWRGMTIWRTPEGKFTVTGKRRNPTWHVPPSMQWKMKMEGKPVKTEVPPGRDNPLGRYAVDLSIPRVVIHETIWPTSVYQFRSHGCIRVSPENMENFFQGVVIGITGEIIYEPVKIAVTGGRIFLEAHRDIYGKVGDLSAGAERLIEDKGFSDKVDWQKVDRVIKEKKGIAEDITL